MIEKDTDLAASAGVGIIAGGSSWLTAMGATLTGLVWAVLGMALAQLMLEESTTKRMRAIILIVSFALGILGSTFIVEHFAVESAASYGIAAFLFAAFGHELLPLVPLIAKRLVEKWAGVDLNE